MDKENLNLKIDELTTIMKKENEYHKDMLDTLQTLSSKIDNLVNHLEEKKYYSRDHILTYVIGAFAGGIIMGLSLISKNK